MPTRAETVGSAPCCSRYRSAQLLARSAALDFGPGVDGGGPGALGVSGVSVACASWSGVVYLPLSPARALHPDEFVSFEVVAQGLWCYSAHILAADDLDQLPERYGWRFLRTARARLTSAGPVETGQVRMMRDAVLSTSRLTEQLTQAQAILRDPN